MRKLLFFLLMGPSLFAQTTIFSCGPAGTAWSATSGSCWADQTFQHRPFGFNGNSPPAVSGNSVILVPSSVSHQVGTVFYAVSPVSTQGFTSTFTFIPNGYNLGFVVQNNTNSSAAGTGPSFSAGATCEAGFYQGFLPPPNNVFALDIDSQGDLDNSGSFAYSSAQIYMGGQTPCNPDDAQTSWFLSNKLSTSPVPLNNPANSSVTTTGDTYQAMVGYDGSNFSFSLVDLTAANGSCSSSTSCTGTFFQHTWTNIPIPSWANGTAGYVGLTSATNASVGNALTVLNWNFATLSPTATPGTSAPSNGGTYAANPTFSPAAGAYSGTQSVTISSTTSGAYKCYALGSSGSVVTPNPDNRGACSVGTLYTGPVSVSSSQTLYAIAGTDDTNCPGTCPATNLPSGLTQGAFTISAATNRTTISGKIGINGKTVIH